MPTSGRICGKSGHNTRTCRDKLKHVPSPEVNAVFSHPVDNLSLSMMEAVAGHEDFTVDDEDNNVTEDDICDMNLWMMNLKATMKTFRSRILEFGKTVPLWEKIFIVFLNLLLQRVRILTLLVMLAPLYSSLCYSSQFKLLLNLQVVIF
jgi:hypothetical protein